MASQSPLQAGQAAQAPVAGGLTGSVQDAFVIAPAHASPHVPAHVAAASEVQAPSQEPEHTPSQAPVLGAPSHVPAQSPAHAPSQLTEPPGAPQQAPAHDPAHDPAIVSGQRVDGSVSVDAEQPPVSPLHFASQAAWPARSTAQSVSIATVGPSPMVAVLA
jgi:hypothetical protein